MRFFDFFPWHIKNENQSELATQILLFTTSWRMPLIFFVSGAGTYFAIKSRKENFISDRIKRLIVPFLFGILILIPPQKFYEYIFNGGDVLSYFSFLRIYPSQLAAADIEWNLSWFGHIGYHIWYLPYLFVQTILLLPIFKLIMKTEGRKNRHLNWSMNLPVLFITLVLINIILRPHFPQYLNWADFFHFLLFFYLGFSFVPFREKFQITLNKYRYPLLIIAISTSILTHYFALSGSYMIKWIGSPDYSWDYAGFMVIRNINSLAWVLLLLHFSIKFLDRKNKYLMSLNESILPVYLLHQTFIVMAGYYIVQLDIGIIPKYLIILFIISLMIYITYKIIKSVNGLRFLFGMKKKPENGLFNVKRKNLLK